jgi:hypothetical protein
MRAMLPSLRIWSSRSAMRLAVSDTFCSADGVVWITGSS